MPTSTETIAILLPEITLVVLAAWIYVGSAMTGAQRGWGLLTLATLFVLAVSLLRQDLALQPRWAGWDLDGAPPQVARVVFGPLTLDMFGQTMRLAAVCFAGLFVLSGLRAPTVRLPGEYLGSLILVFVGLMLASTAGDLVLLFVGLELVSIPTYVLLYLGRTDDASAEAAAKYFYLSILASSLLLYGISFLYGVAGSTGLVEIRDQLVAASAGGAGAELLGLLPLGLVLIFAGLGFKIAAVPFHFYAPDVYQGASHLNAGLLAVVPKIAGVVALVRLVVLAMPTIQPLGWQIALALAALTMTLGNVCALWQKNIRRLMAYSSIAHAGYMLIALAVALASSGSRAPTYEGLGALLFYLLIYGVATAGTFASLACLSGGGEELNDVVQLSGLGRSRPWLAAALAVFMFSLAGIPPLAGFWGKLTLFTAALGTARDLGDSAAAWWFLVLAVVAALNAAVAAGYYLRVVGVIYFHEPVGGRTVGTDGVAGAGLAALACAVLMVVGGILHGPLLQRAREAGRAAMLSRPMAASPQPALERTARPPRPAGVAAQLE